MFWIVTELVAKRRIRDGTGSDENSLTSCQRVTYTPVQCFRPALRQNKIMLGERSVIFVLVLVVLTVNRTPIGVE